MHQTYCHEFRGKLDSPLLLVYFAPWREGACLQARVSSSPQLVRICLICFIQKQGFLSVAERWQKNMKGNMYGNNAECCVRLIPDDATSRTHQFIGGWGVSPNREI